MSNRTPKSATRKTRTSAKSKAAPNNNDRGLEERITERLDRESLARLQASSARPAAFPEHLGELVSGSKLQRNWPPDAIAAMARPGMMVSIPEESDLIIVQCTPDFCIAEDAKGNRHVEYWHGVSIERVEPDKQIASEKCTDDLMKQVHKIDGLLFKIGEVVKALRDIVLPENARSFIQKYPAMIRDDINTVVCNLNEWRSNWMDDLIGNVDESPDRPLRSASEMRADGAANAA